MDIDKSLKILLNIDNIEHNIPLSSLFDIAARENLKREFLFVSKVLGKHIPINPNTLKIIGGVLAREWLEKNEGLEFDDTNLLIQALIDLQAENNINATMPNSNLRNALNILSAPIELKEKTLFIGFAETATGIAQAVFNNFTNASYIHTTRENILTLEPNFVFKEEHSHAVNHSLYSLDKDFFTGFERIVLIDDELTTGNTALNLLKNLPGKAFGIITILDWRSKEQLNKFENVDDIDIKICSLVKGTIIIEKKGPSSISDNPIEIETGTSLSHSEINLIGNNLIEGYLPFTGRFGINSKQNTEINKEIKKVGKILIEKRTAGNCLCLGTEEFIYIPCMISAELGEKVYFHSTTKSPIYSRNVENYCIKNKVKFPCPFDNKTMNYLYNIPKGFYNQVFLFSEKPLTENSKLVFKNIFSTFDIKDIVFVSWT